MAFAVGRGPPPKRPAGSAEQMAGRVPADGREIPRHPDVFGRPIQKTRSIPSRGKYGYFSDQTMSNRQSARELAAGEFTCPEEPKVGFHLGMSKLSAPDKYFYFGEDEARFKGKARPASDGPTTFTDIDWDALKAKRVRELAKQQELRGMRPPPDTSYSRVYLNWTDEAESRRLMKAGLDPQPDLVPRRAPNVPVRQHLSASVSIRGTPLPPSNSAPQLVTDSNSVGGMRACISHIFPDGHVTYDKLLSKPWRYNDQMKCSSTTHTRFPMEVNC